jgi:FkbM family methyltransferase
MPTAKLGTYSVTFDNSEEYHRLKNEIFTHHQYYFETENPQPVIIDAGAHIGLATLYFKKNYPGAVITAIEPQLANFKLLEKNIWDNDLSNVETHQVALSDKMGTAKFFQDVSDDKWYSTASFTPRAWNGQQSSQEVTVPTQPLSDFITGPIDLLKMDIEGAEVHVLHAAVNKLHLVKYMMVEYHPTPGNDFKFFTEWLKKHNLSWEIWQKGKLITNYQHGLALLHITHR